MTNQQILAGDWNEIKGRLRQRWGELTDDDLPQIRGDAEQIIGAIQRKTGEAHEAIAQYLQELSSSAVSATDTVTETISDQSQHASEAVQQLATQAADQMRAGYHAAERVVRDRPGASLAVCFGAGLVTGVVIALSLRSR